MAEVINLRLARKARKRRQAAEQAAENRARHGLTAAERQHQRSQAERTARRLDAHLRDKP